MQFDYHVVDVFTQTPLEGNALAVFPDARGLDAATMQQIARELNLSETTFVLPPAQARTAARVRIFTPAAEMRFAGHPTLGTAFVIRELGIVEQAITRFTLEENIGPVSVRIEDGEPAMYWLETPPIATGRAFDPADCARALGLEPRDVRPGIACRLLSAGNPNIYVAVNDTAAVDRAEVDTPALRALLDTTDRAACLFVFTPTAAGAYARMFAPEQGVREDPATGSAMGPLAVFMMDNALIGDADGTRFSCEQGTKMGRRSELHVRLSGKRGRTAIEVGGCVTPLAVATLTLSHVTATA